MKTTQKLMVALGALVIASTAQAGFSFPGVGDAQNLVNNPQAACKKGDVFTGTFSLRSASGMAGNYPVLAAISQLICPGAADDYNGSGLNKNALSALNGQDPADVLRAFADDKTPAGLKGKSDPGAGKFAKAFLNAVCTTQSQNPNIVALQPKLKCPGK